MRLAQPALVRLILVIALSLSGLAQTQPANMPPSAQQQPPAQATATQAGKKPLTHEAMWMLKRVGAPAVSPDGKWVVFGVTEPAYDEKDQLSDLWIVPADGSESPRRLTSTRSGESGVVWSRDSKRIAFSAKREGDEAAQVYVLDIRGGEAQRVTNISTGARVPQWRPDGKAILFVSSVYPGTSTDEENKRIASERKNRKYNARVYDRFPIRYWDRWLDEKQVHLFVQPLEQGAKAKDLLAGTEMVKKRGYAGRLTNSSEELDAIWAPDGNSIVFAASTDRDAAAYADTGMHLYRVAATGGEPVAITGGTGSHGNPRFSPDGKALYFDVEPASDRIYNQTRLAMLPWPELGQPVIITSSFDRSVGRYAITPDSKTIYLLAEDAGHEKIYSVPAKGGEVKLAVDAPEGVYGNLAIPEQAGSTMLFATWESAVRPPEVVRVDLGSRRPQFLSDFATDAAAQIDWQPLREFWFTSKAGKKIHNFVVLPQNFDPNKKYPVLALIHGGPHTMWRDQITLRWNYHLLASPGYVLVLTNYTGSTGFGEKFAQAIQLDPLKGPGDEVNEAVDEAVRQFAFIDGTRMAAGGASYGGHLANWLQATTTRYKCLISHAGLINLESQWGASDMIYHRELSAGGPLWANGNVWREQNPIRFAANFKTPILVSVGENDFRVPLSQTIENWSVLQRMKVPSRLLVFPDENHWIQKGENSRYFYQEVHAWLKHYLQDGAGQSAAGK